MKSVSSFPVWELGPTTDQIEVVAILKAVMESDNPFCSTWRAHKGSRFQDVPFSSNVALLAFT
jgi:hypothetical protein